MGLWKGPHYGQTLFSLETKFRWAQCKQQQAEVFLPWRQDTCPHGLNHTISALFSSQLSSQLNSHICITWVSTFTCSDRGRARSRAPSNVRIKRTARSRSERFPKNVSFIRAVCSNTAEALWRHPAFNTASILSVQKLRQKKKRQ